MPSYPNTEASQWSESQDQSEVVETAYSSVEELKLAVSEGTCARRARHPNECSSHTEEWESLTPT